MNRTTYPHILFINTDQLKTDFLGCYGFPADTTPAMDRLAAEGMCFDNAFTQCPICTPARYSLLSGNYVSNHGALTNNHGAYPAVPSLLDAFNKNNYHTVAIGKLHHNPPEEPFGFREVLLHDGTFPARRKYSIYSKWLIEQGVDEDDLAYAVDVDDEPEKRRYKDRLHWGRCRLDDEHCESTFLADTAVDYLDNHETDQPLFLYLSFVAPHSPYCPPAPYDTMFDPKDMPVPPRETEAQLDKKHRMMRQQLEQLHGAPEEGISDETIQAIRAQYAGLIRHMDDNIQRVIDQVRLKLGDDVLICLTTDHGDFMGEHHRFQKHLMYDGATRVPFIVNWPGHVAAGKRVSGQIEQIDMLPTVLGLAGVDEHLCRCPGQDRSEGILAGSVAGNEFVFSEHWRAMGKCAEYTAMVRSEGYKLIAVLDRDRKRPLFFEFYDLEKDPYELENLIGDDACQAEIQRHREALLEYDIRIKAYAPNPS